MPVSTMNATGIRVRRFSVTIPANVGTAVTLLSLVQADANWSAVDNNYIIGGKVNKAVANYIAGDSTSSLPITITAGDPYEEPVGNFLASTYVKTASGGSTTATVSVWLTGDGKANF